MIYAHAREDRRENVGVSGDFPVQLPTRLVSRRSAAVIRSVLHEDPRRLVQHARFSGEDPREVVG